MVMQYMPERDLRHYLSKNNKNLKDKLAQKKELIQEIELSQSLARLYQKAIKAEKRVTYAYQGEIWGLKNVYEVQCS